MVEVKKSLKNIFAHKRRAAKEQETESDVSDDEWYDEDSGDGSKSRPLTMPWKLMFAILVIISMFYILVRNDAAAQQVSASQQQNLGGATNTVPIPGVMVPDAFPVAMPPKSEPIPAAAVQQQQAVPPPPPPPPPGAVSASNNAVAPQIDAAALEKLEAATNEKIEQIRKMKFVDRIVIEKDAAAQGLIREAQSMLRQVLTAKYGPGPYYVAIKIQFPAVMVQNNGAPQEATLIVELAPIVHVPYSVYFFIENLMHKYAGGAFHRNAGHVLQAMVHPSDKKTLNFAWQEYSPSFPHAKYTLGYAGRPSSNRAFYISAIDNTRNHGPGSQGSATEADACFGRLVDGANLVALMLKQPGKGGSGFITSQDNFIKILSMELMPRDYKPQSMLRGGAAAAAASV